MTSLSDTLPTLGAELEMVVIDAAGQSACVGEGYFAALADLRRDRGPVRFDRIGNRTVALNSAPGVNGIDNGFNLLETAHAPVAAGQGGLGRLSRAMQDDLHDVVAALGREGLALTSLAQHPTAGTGPGQYARAVAPKSVYAYLTGNRGWDHAAGIDAKAQNGPTTGLTVDGCIAALNLLLATAPAFIALFANSPFEAGARSGLMETRMTLWPRMVARSRVPADLARCGLPPRWFTDLDDYFHWTFGPGTVMHAIPPGIGSYKGAAQLFVAGDGALNAQDFFRGGPVGAQAVTGNDRAMIVPVPAHFEFLQWSNFLDFRLRFALGPGVGDIGAAFAERGGFERLFREHATNLYLENRCAGASFSDADLAEQAAADVVESCMIAPSALQAGLVMAATTHGADFLRRWPLDEVRRLRDHAIRHALSGQRDSALAALCAEALDLARAHLPQDARPTLAYADWVLETGKCGAQRALDHWARLGEPPLDRLAVERKVIA